MKLRISYVIEVDPETWASEWDVSAEPGAVIEDVETYFSAMVHPAGQKHACDTAEIVSEQVQVTAESAW